MAGSLATAKHYRSIARLQIRALHGWRDLAARKARVRRGMARAEQYNARERLVARAFRSWRKWVALERRLKVRRRVSGWMGWGGRTGRAALLGLYLSVPC